jgi:hypothetical protein
MSGTANLETRPKIERGPTLRPIVSRLLGAINDHAKDEGSLKIGVKQYTVEISAWEREIVLEVKERGLVNTTYWGYRLLEALAVQAKGFSDLSRLSEGGLSAEQDERCRQDLVADYALGCALEAELTAVIKALEDADRRGAAKNLSDTRHRLSENLHPMRNVLTDEEAGQANTLAAELFVALDEETLQGAGTATPSGNAPANPVPVLTARPARPTRTAPEAPVEKALSGRHLMLAAVGTVLFVVAAAFLIPMVGSSYDVSQAFQHIPGVRGYVGEPPAATVTISPTEWSLLDRPGRSRLVSSIGAALSKAGYTRATIVTPEKTPVAEWVKNEGAKIL